MSSRFAKSPFTSLAVIFLLSAVSFSPPTGLKCYQQLYQWTEDSGQHRKDGGDIEGRMPSFVSSFYVAASTVNGTLTPDAMVDIGLQAQIDSGYPLDLVVSNILPRRLFLIYGLESSGTTFTAKTIAKAVGIPKERMEGDRMETKEGRTQVHHISLPLGWEFQVNYSQPIPIVPVFYPLKCQVEPMFPKRPPVLQNSAEVENNRNACRQVIGDKAKAGSRRFFVNITSNIRWYRERGVRVYPIMVVRDLMLHFQGIVKSQGGHCSDEKAAYQQYEQGRAIMLETIEKGLNPLILSYEAILTLQGPYLNRIYRQLGIATNHTAGFRNGNTKYVTQSDHDRPYVEKKLMEEDAPSSQKNYSSNTLKQFDSIHRIRPKGKTHRAQQRDGEQLAGQSHSTRSKKFQVEERESQDKQLGTAMDVSSSDSPVVTLTGEEAASYVEQVQRIQRFQAARSQQHKERTNAKRMRNN